MSKTETQSEALRLAEFFGSMKKSSHRWYDGVPVHEKAAAELRRLDAENKALRERLEAPATPVEDEEAAFTKWFQGEQGKPYQGMWEFAHAAWMARSAAPAVGARVQWWLARLDQYGNPKLVDGAHSHRTGADQAAYLIAAMNLSQGEKYVVARVELTEPRPNADGVNQKAIALHNRAAQAAAKNGGSA